MFIKKNINNLFYFFVIVHLVIWTLVPTLTNKNLPLDVIEALAWGSNLDWGFTKHPPGSAFFPEIFFQIFGSQDWAFYLLSQIFVVSSFYIVWLFANEFFKNKILSLLSIVILEGIYFYNFTTPEFNVNVCQMPFWALTIYLSWKILIKKELNIFFPIGLGLVAAIGFLSKYLFIYLLLSIFLISYYLFFIRKKIKFNFKHYIPLEVFFVALIPHLIWLFQNDFITIKYALSRSGIDDYNFLDHFKYPIIFFVKQIVVLIPFFVLVYFLIKRIKIRIDLKDDKNLFLIAINIIPIMLILFTSIIFGSEIRTMWMAPFYLFFGVLALSLFEIHENKEKLLDFLKPLLILFFLSPITYAAISLIKDDKRTDYDGHNESIEVAKVWEKNFELPINVVLGDEWHAGNISYHMKSRPIWLGEINQTNVDKLDVYICVKKVCVGHR